MDIDEAARKETRLEARRVSRRQLIQDAIAYAMQSQWQEAAQANLQVVEMTPGDAEAHNRLGKSYTELGRVPEARAAYEQALRADPANLIAQRNLDRLSLISDAEAAEMIKRAGRKLDPRFFMEETGKTGVTVLERPAATEVLATLTAGDQITLENKDGRLVVTTIDGVQLGQVEELLAVRLARLIQSGNQYQAGVVGVDGTTVRVIIREIYQAPPNAGRISFPPRTAADSLPRPYLREGLLRRGTSEDEDDDDLDSDLQDETGDEDEEDNSEFNFRERNLDES